MDCASSTINYLFTPPIGGQTNSLKPPAAKNTHKPTATPTDDTSTIDATQTTKTDNNYAVAQKTSEDNENKPPQQFQNTLNEKVATKVNTTSQQTQNGQEQNTQGPAAAQPAVVQQWLTNRTQTVENGKEGVETGTLPKIGYALAQSLAEVKPSNPSGSAAKSELPAQNKPNISAAKNPLGLKLASDKTSTTAVPVNNSPAQDKTPVATTNSAIQQNTQESTAETTSTSDTKQTVANKLTAPDENQNTLVSNSKDSIPEPTETGEKPAATDKPAASQNQQTPQSNTQLSSTLDNSSILQQKTSNNTQDSSADTEKPADNKTSTSQIFSETSNNNGKIPQTNQNYSPANTLLQKLNPQQLETQTSSSQTEQDDNSTSENNSNPNFEQILPNNTQPPNTEQTSPPMPFITKTSDAAPPDNTAQNINEQILESMHSTLRQGNQEITLRLNPPELGRVTIKFQQTDGQIIGLLEVSKSQTRAEIQQALPQLMQDLQNSGIQIKRLEVTLANQPEQQTFKEQFFQDGNLNQQTGSDTNNQNYNNNSDWLTNINSYLNSAEPQDMFVTDNAINVLI